MLNSNRRSWIKSATLISTSAFISKSLKFPAEPQDHTAASSSTSFWEWENSELVKSKIDGLKARLLANENPYGPSPKAKEAIFEAVTLGNRYGQSYSKKLIEKIAAKEGVPTDHIILAPGSSDLLEKTAVSLFTNGGNIVSADPAYMSLIKSAESIGGDWKPIPLKEDYTHDLSTMKGAITPDTKMVYICNPNNPTGTITPAADLESFCKEVSKETLVFVDEAYLEFMEETPDKKSMVGLISEGYNVIVCRTFSKAHGMAGMRVGYIVGLPKTLEMITKTYRGNMSMNIAAVIGALASMDDLDFISDAVAKNKECRDYTIAELAKLGFTCLPSQTSFILFPIQMNGKQFLEKMFSLGVGVRAFHVFGGDYCRVSLGTMDEMKMFLGALKEVLV